MKNGTYLMDTEGNLKPLEIKTGYWVAEREIDLSDVEAGQIVGIWTDDNGKEWIDESHLVSDLGDALELAQAWNQIAIWDNSEQKPISL
jgi:hypothetical protein